MVDSLRCGWLHFCGGRCSRSALCLEPSDMLGELTAFMSYILQKNYKTCKRLAQRTLRLTSLEHSWHSSE